MSLKYFFQFSEGLSLAPLDESFMTAMLTPRDQLVENLTSGQYAISHEENGGFRRIMCLTNLVFPASGAVTAVLDDTVDYRDRLLWFGGPIDLRADTILHPGHPDDGFFNVAGALFLEGRVYYTRNGYAVPATGSENYWRFRGSNEILVYADVSTGALKMTLVSGGAGTGQFATLGMLHASPVLNEYRTVPDLPLFDTLDLEPVEAHDLNNLQDGVHMAQMRGGDTLPLGPVTEGDAPLSRVWNVRGETVKQRITNPQLRRFVSFTCAQGDVVVLDRSFDWRDRIVHANFVFSATTDRRPGTAGEALGGSFASADADPLVFNGYTGPGDDSTRTPFGSDMWQMYTAANDGVLYADEDTGFLMWSMVGESTDIAYANMLLLASPQLGPRSGMKDPRNFQTPSFGKPTTPIVDSVSTDLTGIIARYRMDRGIALDGGRVAGIADQSGHGHHLVQYNPALRAFPPATRAILNSQLAIELTGSEYYESVKPLPASTVGYYIGIVLEPDTAASDFAPFEQLLALTTEGQVFTRIDSADVHGLWQPNATATPDYETEDTGGNYAAGALVGIAWLWDIDGGDATRLLPEVAVRDTLGTTTGSITSTSPSATGLADVQRTLWRLLEGIDGHVAEVVICDAAQTTVSDFLNSADLITRYGF